MTLFVRNYEDEVKVIKFDKSNLLFSEKLKRTPAKQNPFSDDWKKIKENWNKIFE